MNSNKMWPKHSHCSFLVSGYFCTLEAELNSHHNDSVAIKSNIINPEVDWVGKTR